MKKRQLDSHMEAPGVATLVDIDEVYDARGQVEFTLTDKKQSLGFKSNLKPNA